MQLEQNPVSENKCNPKDGTFVENTEQNKSLFLQEKQEEDTKEIPGDGEIKIKTEEDIQETTETEIKKEEVVVKEEPGEAANVSTSEMDTSQVSCGIHSLLQIITFIPTSRNTE